MSQVKQAYLKDENGNVISPIVSSDSIKRNKEIKYPVYENGFADWKPENYGKCYYYKDNGRVYLNGLAGSSSDDVAVEMQKSIFTLPVGYRPKYQTYHCTPVSTIESKNDTVCIVRVNPNGSVNTYGIDGNINAKFYWISLYNISFDVE